MVRDKEKGANRKKVKRKVQQTSDVATHNNYLVVRDIIPADPSWSYG